MANRIAIGVGNALRTLGEGYGRARAQEQRSSRTKELLDAFQRAEKTTDKARILMELDPKQGVKYLNEQEKSSQTNQYLKRLGYGPQDDPDAAPQGTTQRGPSAVNTQQNQLTPEEEDEAIVRLTDLNPKVGGAAQKNREHRTKAERAARKEALDIHSMSDKYWEKVNEEEKTALQHQISSGNVRDLIESGGYDPTSLENLMATVYEGSKWAEYFKTPERAQLEAASLADYNGARQVFGGIMSDRDVRIASGKVINPKNSNEANLAILDYRDLLDSIPLKEAEIGREIIEQNGGLRPLNFADQVRQKMRQEYSIQFNHIAAKAANDGELMPIPTEIDPLMESVYDTVPQGRIRVWNGAEVKDIPAAFLDEAIKKGFMVLEKGAQ